MRSKCIHSFFSTSVFAYAAAAMLWVVPGTASAQAAQPERQDPPGSVDTVSRPQRLDDIIVTAERRSQNIQDVPIAISAITGDALASAGVQNSRQIQLLVPSLVFSQDSGFGIPFLRGVGTQVTVPGAENSVATFVDGVYVASQLSSVVSLLGVDRVEVLAGPQGTLYGRNASGGAINIYTLTPKQELEASASLSYGNYDQMEGSAYVSGGLTSTISAGIYVGGNKRDGFVDFVPPVPDGQLDYVSNWGVRGKVVWEPSSAFKVTGMLEHSEQRNGDAAYRNIQENAVSYAFGAPKIIEDYVVSEAFPQFTKSKVTFGTLRAEADLSFGKLVSLSGYRRLNLDIAANFPGAAAPLLSVFGEDSGRQFSQEFQILSKESSPVKWVAGLYYFDAREGYLPLVQSSDFLFQPSPATVFSQTSSQETRSYAAFAQATVPLDMVTPGLSVTVGGRYTEDRKRLVKQTLNQLLSDGTLAAVPGNPLVLPDAEKKWSKFTPKVTLSWKSSGGTLVYATYAQGYKSGVFNSSTLGSPAINPETLTDYEVGLKGDAFDRRLRFNVAAYHYRLKDQQVQTITSSGTGVQSVFLNAADAKAFGVEMSAQAAVTDRLRINASAAWEHSEFTNFPNAPFYNLLPSGNAPVAGVSASGNPLVQAPKFVATLNPQYSMVLSNGSELVFDASVYYNSGYSFTPTQQVEQEAHTLLNGSIAYTLPNKDITFSVWGNNITDKQYFSYKAVTGLSTYALDAAPRTYGATISYKY